MTGAHVAISVTNYNGSATLLQTLDSLFKQSYLSFEVIVVDNCSTDQSCKLASDTYPDLRIINLEKNLGPAGARNWILTNSDARYVLLVDNDIVLQPDVLTLLTRAFDDVPGTGIAHPEITDIKDPTVGMHYNGAQIHYLCASIARAVTPSADLRSQYEVFDSVSGAVLLVDRALALELGGFDEDFFFNWEDGDFTIRFTLAGYKVVNVPAASALHHGKERGTTMVFYQVRNRWFFVLKYYSARTLFLVFPMFVIYEASQVIFLTLQGALGEYFRAVTAVIRSFPELRKKRQAFRCRKIKADNEWLHSGEVYVPPALLKSRMQVRLKNLYFGFFNLYWAIVRRFCW